MTEGTLEEIKAGLVRTQLESAVGEQTIEQLSVYSRPRAAQQWIPCSYSQERFFLKPRIKVLNTF